MNDNKREKRQPNSLQAIQAQHTPTPLPAPDHSCWRYLRLWVSGRLSSKQIMSNRQAKRALKGLITREGSWTPQGEQAVKKVRDDNNRRKAKFPK